MGVDALDHHGSQMLQFQGEDALHAHHERTWIRPALLLPLGTARPFELRRLTEAGEALADDIGPGREDIGGGEPLRGESRSDTGLDQLGEGFDAGHELREFPMRAEVA